MKYRKTYGINGLLEWHGIVESGNVRMKVDFTNGSVTAFGVDPATFTTEDALTQLILENSEQFKSGRIKIIRKISLEREEKMEQLSGVVTDLKELGIKPHVKLHEVEDVYNCSDARLWLKEHKNINVIGKSKAEIIEIAEAEGVSFPNIVKK